MKNTERFDGIKTGSGFYVSKYCFCFDSNNLRTQEDFKKLIYGKSPKFMDFTKTGADTCEELFTKRVFTREGDYLVDNENTLAFSVCSVLAIEDEYAGYLDSNYVYKDGIERDYVDPMSLISYNFFNKVDKLKTRDDEEFAKLNMLLLSKKRQHYKEII